MNLHVFQRATTQALVAFIASGTGIAAVAKEANERQVMPWEVVLILGGFLVMFAGTMTLALVRWLNKVSQNVPRDPTRMDQVLGNIGHDLTDMRKSVAELQGEVRQLQRDTAKQNARLSRTEGQMDQLVVVVPERRR